MGSGRVHGQLICYNWGGPRHYACDCTNTLRASCLYFTQIDNEMEDCPTLIAKLHDKGTLQPPTTQNLQMMRSEPHADDSNVNIVLRSGIMIGDDKGKQLKECA